MKRTHFLLILSVVLIFAACEKRNTISGAGNSFSYPFYSVLLDNFYNNTGIEVIYNKTSVNISIHALYNQTIDFMPVFYLPDNIEQAFNKQVVFVPCMAGAIVLAYNLPQADSLNLNAAAISAIYSGEVTHWNHPMIQDLNPDIVLKEIPITPIYRMDDSGSSVILTDYLRREGFEFMTDNNLFENKISRSAQGVGTKGDESIASSILDTEGAIGFLGIEQATLQNLNTACIYNSAGNYVRADNFSIEEAIKHPQPGNVLLISNSPAAEAYPLSTFCGILINRYPNRVNEAKQDNLITFLKYLLNPDIQQRAALMNYVPLSDSMLLRANRLINSIEYAEL